MARAFGAVLLAAGLAGCGQFATTSTRASTPAVISVTTKAHRRARRPSGAGRRHRRRAHRHASSGLAYSRASAEVVQAQPPAGSCHAVGSGDFSRPDPRCTPGAVNPAVTQGTIAHTICMAGWTSTIRPPESVSEAEKQASLAAYGDAGPLSLYEYDHFVPLELGGAANDPRNLWPEPGASPNPKDAVEDELNHRVCDGQMTLAAAQHAIAMNWTALARDASAPSAPASATQAAARCSVRASYSPTHHDYDVYVNSNQPDQTVTVSDTSGESDSWHTNAEGYADVYFHAGSAAAGETVTARVGGATCSGTL